MSTALLVGTVHRGVGARPGDASLPGKCAEYDSSRCPEVCMSLRHAATNQYSAAGRPADVSISVWRDSGLRIRRSRSYSDSYPISGPKCWPRDTQLYGDLSYWQRLDQSDVHAGLHRKFSECAG